jgi:hypothetical protein
MLQYVPADSNELSANETLQLEFSCEKPEKFW